MLGTTYDLPPPQTLSPTWSVSYVVGRMRMLAKTESAMPYTVHAVDPASVPIPLDLGEVSVEEVAIGTADI